MGDLATDTAFTSQTINEFGTLMDRFEALALPEVDELLEFLADFTRMEATKTPTLPVLPCEEAQDFLSEFQEKWFARLEDDAETTPMLNIWKIAGLGLDEVRNCRVLKWLLDPAETHSQGIRFLNCFLQEIGEPPLSASGADVQVRREVTMSEGVTPVGRVDITVESPSIFLWIEAKIRAQEDPAQLEGYFHLAHSQLHGRRFIGRLLTALGTSGEQVVSGFKRMLWSDVARALRNFGGAAGDPLRATRDRFVGRLALQYADFIHSHFKTGNQR